MKPFKAKILNLILFLTILVGCTFCVSRMEVKARETGDSWAENSYLTHTHSSTTPSATASGSVNFGTYSSTNTLGITSYGDNAINIYSALQSFYIHASTIGALSSGSYTWSYNWLIKSASRMMLPIIFKRDTDSISLSLVSENSSTTANLSKYEVSGDFYYSVIELDSSYNVIAMTKKGSWYSAQEDSIYTFNSKCAYYILFFRHNSGDTTIATGTSTTIEFGDASLNLNKYNKLLVAKTSFTYTINGTAYKRYGTGALNYTFGSNTLWYVTDSSGNAIGKSTGYSSGYITGSDLNTLCDGEGFVEKFYQDLIITQVCNLTLNLNGGTITASGTTFSYMTLSGYCKYGTTTNYSVSIPTRDGYKFLGYYTSSGTQIYNSNGVCTNDGTYFKSNKWNYTGNAKSVVLYAKWEKNEENVYVSYQDSSGNYSDYELLYSATIDCGQTFSWDLTSAGIDTNVYYLSFLYSSSPSGTFSKTSSISYTVDGANTWYIKLQRRCYTIKVYYKIQDSDVPTETYAEYCARTNYSLKYNTTVYYGATYPYEITANTFTDDLVTYDEALDIYGSYNGTTFATSDNTIETEKFLLSDMDETVTGDSTIYIVVQLHLYKITYVDLDIYDCDDFDISDSSTYLSKFTKSMPYGKTSSIYESVYSNWYSSDYTRKNGYECNYEYLCSTIITVSENEDENIIYRFFEPQMEIYATLTTTASQAESETVRVGGVAYIYLKFYGYGKYVYCELPEEYYEDYSWTINIVDDGYETDFENGGVIPSTTYTMEFPKLMEVAVPSAIAEKINVGTTLDFYTKNKALVKTATVIDYYPIKISYRYSVGDTIKIKCWVYRGSANDFFLNQTELTSYDSYLTGKATTISLDINTAAVTFTYRIYTAPDTDWSKW